MGTAPIVAMIRHRASFQVTGRCSLGFPPQRMRNLTARRPLGA